MSRILTILLVVVTTAASGWSCSVPVFRYALERWAPNAYDLWIFHHGALSATDMQFSEELQALATSDSAHANVAVQWVDVTETMSPAAAEVWRGQSADHFPHAVLTFAANGKATGVAYSGPANRASMQQLWLSPTRQKIVERLLDGDSAVWLLVESGDPMADSAALDKLTTTLAEAEQELKIVEEASDDAKDATLDPGKPPLRISFPILRLSRTNAEEAGFIQLLTATFTPHPSANQPFTLAVCGQGRAIASLSGDEIDSNYIKSWCAFIAGACSCQVKAELPGSDLLLRADWSQLRDGRRIKEPESANVAAIIDAASEKSATNVTRSDARLSEENHSSAVQAGLWQQLGWWSLAVVVVLIGFTGWHFMRVRKG